MRGKLLLQFCCCALLLAGCTTPPRTGLTPPLTPHLLSRELGDKILALDPERVSEADLRETLAQVPAPQILNIHGGIYPVYLAMESFTGFLIGMGYPEACVKRPDGSCSYSCYGKAEAVAGAAAWYYGRTGLRPMIVGHSQGGMQTVKVLHLLAGKGTNQIPVWNPLTDEPETRFAVTDPLTGRLCPVRGFRVCYATAVGAGGITRALPNQWDVDGRLRSVPDSVEEFTGFYLGFDLLGGDTLGFGSANSYKAEGRAAVRNVQLPATYHHCTVPCTQHLAENLQVKAWVNNYNTPVTKPEFNEKFSADTANILWAADVWHSIKKHWVLELQNLIRAQREPHHEH